MHKPVLLKEVLEILDPKEGEYAIDATADGGGHARALIEKIGKSGKFTGLDWDARMVKKLKSEKFFQSPNVRIICANFAEIEPVLEKANLGKADIILADLGFSSEQLESSGRGFSFLKNEPLLMTYSDELEPVYRIIRRLTENELADVIYQFGEERYSRRAARAIKEELRKNKIETTKQLADCVFHALPRNYERRRIHPATRTFQALRIFANHELENITKFCESIQAIAKSGARVAVISFHSLEDRIVKQKFRAMVEENQAEFINKKPIMATEDEIKDNPRSRSAKLRGIKTVISDWRRA